MKYVVDIDDTICHYSDSVIRNGYHYENAEPNKQVIEMFNNLYEQGHEIVYYTARGTETGEDWTWLTTKQLVEWGVKCDDLKFGKPSADMYVDDKAMNINDILSKAMLSQELEKQTIVEKPWGTEFWLDVTSDYVMKRLVIRDGHWISKQYHEYKTETWHVVDGEGIAHIGDKTMVLHQGVTISIPVGLIHQVKAINGDLHIIECSTVQTNDVVHVSEGWAD